MCEVPQISSAISQDETLLEKLFAFMESDSPLNPLLASFFTKAVGNILTRKSEQVSAWVLLFFKPLYQKCEKWVQNEVKMINYSKTFWQNNMNFFWKFQKMVMGIGLRFYGKPIDFLNLFLFTLSIGHDIFL